MHTHTHTHTWFYFHLSYKVMHNQWNLKTRDEACQISLEKFKLHYEKRSWLYLHLSYNARHNQSNLKTWDEACQISIEKSKSHYENESCFLTKTNLCFLWEWLNYICHLTVIQFHVNHVFMKLVDNKLWQAWKEYMH